MKIEINGNTQKQMLTAVDILRYLMGTDERLDTQITCGISDEQLVTTDFELYQAVGSIKDYDNFTRNKLVKFLENVDVATRRLNQGNKTILTHEMVETLRTKALKGGSNE